MFAMVSSSLVHNLKNYPRPFSQWLTTKIPSTILLMCFSKRKDFANPSTVTLTFVFHHHHHHQHYSRSVSPQTASEEAGVA
jgi:hypothetical protein